MSIPLVSSAGIPFLRAGGPVVAAGASLAPVYEGGAQDLVLAEDQPMTPYPIGNTFLGVSMVFSSLDLPAGLTISAGGSISGTPTTSQSATACTVTATNSFGSDDATINITVLPIPPVYTGGAPDLVLTEDLPMEPASMGGFFTGPNPDFSATGLPSGLSIHLDTGEITGTPTTVQAATACTVTATNLGGSDDATFNITVQAGTPPPSEALLEATSIIYVSPTGNDANGRVAITSTAAAAIAAAKLAPMRTPQGAANKAIAGTAVIFKNGTYSAASSTTRVLSLTSSHAGTAELPIFFIAENRRGAILSGPTNESVIRIFDSEYVEIHGFRLVGNYPVTGASDFACVKFESASDESTPLHIVVADCSMEGSANDAVKGGTVSNVRILGCEFSGNWREETIDFVTCHDSEIGYCATAGRIMCKGGSIGTWMHHNFVLSNREAILDGELGASRATRPMPVDPPFPWAEAKGSIIEYNHAKSTSTTAEPIWSRGTKSCIYRFNYCDPGVNNLRGLHFLRAAAALYQDATIPGSVPAPDLPYIKTQGASAPFDYFTWCRSNTVTGNAFRTGATTGSLKDANQNNLLTESGWFSAVSFEAAFPGVIIGPPGWDAQAAYYRVGLRS